jgi:hypothetical protein
MRRILLVMSVALVMAAVLVVSAMPVLAAPPANKPGQYSCFNLFTGTLDRNVPQGKTAQPEYIDPFFGFSTCSRNN